MIFLRQLRKNIEEVQSIHGKQGLMLQKQKISKKERRLLRQKGVIVENALNSMPTITPLTLNQKKAFDAYHKNKNIVLHGTAGTGKTFVAFYLALSDVLESQYYHKMVIIRSVVPSREMGFLPGNQKEKIKVYESPYYGICTELFDRGDAYDILKQKNQIEFISTSFIRGTTLKDCVVVVDEIQNMTWAELSTVLTRIGDNCRIILCGDTKQSDLTEKTGKSDILKLLEVCKNMKSFEFIQMTRNDIVRSGFVKEFIINCEDLGY